MNPTQNDSLTDSSDSITDGDIFSILNESGVEVMLAIAYSSEDNNRGNGFSHNYQVMTLIDGSTFIEASTTRVSYPETKPDNYDANALPTTVSARVKLDKTFTDLSGNSKIMSLYNTVFFRNSDNWFFPVLNTAALNLFGWNWSRKFYTNSNGTNSKIAREKMMTVYDTDVTAMQQTENFLQIIAANPSSKAATDYYNAISNDESTDTSAGSSGTASVNSLNKSIKQVTSQFDDYKHVDLYTITSVQSYFNTVPYKYANYQDEQYFYFYGNKSGTTAFVGRMDLIKDCIATDTLNGGYNITYYPAKNPEDTSKFDVDILKSVNIIYTDGYFYDEAGTRIYIAGSFIEKNSYTSNNKDFNTIIAVLTGAIDGYESCSAVASDFIMTDSATSAEKSIASYWKNLGTTSQIISVLVMGKLAISVLLYGYKGLLSLFAKKGSEVATKDEENDAANEAAEDQVSCYEKFQSKTRNTSEDYNLTDDVLEIDVPANTGYMTDSLTSAVNTIELEQLDNDISSAHELMVDTAKYSNNMTTEQLENLQNAGGDLQTCESKANSVDVTDSDASAEIENLFSNSSVNINLSKINSTINDLSYSVARAVNTDITNNTNINSRTIEDVKTNGKTIKADEVETGDSGAEVGPSE
ncbi:MAG: hypothetical protein GY714_32045 [Desulfobacterales bacterium]|nr:hypothetical protein [Desulfobacterales bacterium]